MSKKFEVLLGDCRDMLRTLPEKSVQTCVTSPPYFNLRDYNTPPSIWGDSGNCEHEFSESSKYGYCLKGCGAWRGNLGQEPTVEQYIANLIEVFREVRRVLRDDGTLWLNLGDSYAGSGKGTWDADDERKGKVKEVYRPKSENNPNAGKTPPGLKPKDLIGVPWRAALALQADGWYLRSDIIWDKPNVMPSSVSDRVTTSHEYIFMLSKKPKYFYDKDAVLEPYAEASLKRINQKTFDTQEGGDKDYAKTGVPGTSQREAIERFKESAAKGKGRNKRSVWRVSTKGFKGAHFAVFPPDLIEPAIKASTSEHGCCSKCGTPFERVTERKLAAITRKTNKAALAGAVDRNRGLPERPGGFEGAESTTTGWAQVCKCKDADVRPCVVFDPFGGSGTTAVVSMRLGRSAIICDLNPDYVAMAKTRIQLELPLG